MRSKKVIELNELTAEQLNYFLKYGYNGCGSRQFTKVPDFIFSLAAVTHDWRYFSMATEEDREFADKEFLDLMLYLAKKQPIYKQGYYRIIAYIYYLAVRLLGKYAFEYSNTAPKTWEEIKTRIDRANLVKNNIIKATIKRLLLKSRAFVTKLTDSI